MRTEISGQKWMLVVAFAAGALLASRGAAAQTPCPSGNDIMCPDMACGGQVCDWSTTPGTMVCHPAGTHKKGEDGWCTTDADCKCRSLGATCAGVFCTFTRPCDAPGAAGCAATATGGVSGTGTGGASSTGTGGASTTGTGGASSTGTGGSSTTGTGGASPPKDSGGGGCAIGGAASSSLLGAMIALGTLITSRRRRNRAGKPA